MAAGHTLCGACSRVFHESKWVQSLAGRVGGADVPSHGHVEVFLHSLDKEQLAASRAAGCHLCTMMVLDDADSDGNNGDNESGVIMAKVGCSSNKLMMTLFRVMNIVASNFPPGDWQGIETALREQAKLGWGERQVYENPISHVSLHLATDTDLLHPRSMLRPGAQLACSTASFESINLARRWLNNCLQNHGRCNTHLSRFKSLDNWLPTRLIDVGTGVGTLTPRLVFSSDFATLTNIQYLALSHSRTISKSSLNLLGHNCDELKRAIPLHALSQTLRDAMLITQLLGHRYIWIDSLCIIQNSAEDWQREAVLMSLVYAKSSCNIAASGMSGVDACFSDRNPLEFFPCYVTDAAHGGAVYACSVTHNPLSMGSASGITKAPLLRRAWVLQERLMSSRTLYFGGPQLYWECCCDMLAESWPFKFPCPQSLALQGEFPSSFVSKVHFMMLCGSSTIPAPQNVLSPEAIGYYLSWQDMLTTYLELQLTFAHDRLIALAGVAKAIEGHLGFTFIAGTWAEFYPLDLLWRYKDTNVANIKRAKSGTNAPSWSWAARGGEMDFFPFKKDLLDENISMELTYVTDVHGFPTRGALSSQYRLDSERKITLSIEGPVKRGTAFTEELFADSVREDGEVDAGKWRHRVFLSNEIAPITVRFDYPIPDGEHVLLLLLLEWNTSEGESVGFYEGGLVLVPEGTGLDDQTRYGGDSHGGNLYRRAGAFKTGEPGAFVWAFSEVDEIVTVRVW